MNALGLCAGVAGIELGLRLAEPSVRPVCFVESEPFAQRILWERYGVPVWDDLKTFDPRPWIGVVELVTAGFPCQPFSSNGQRKRTSDHRWIWKWIAAIIRKLRPRFVFLENVPGVLANPVQQVACERRPTVLGDPGMKRWFQ